MSLRTVWKNNMTKKSIYKALDLDGLTVDELRINQENIRKKIIDLENREYYNNVIRKFKQKYEGQWVKLKGSFNGSYDGDTGFRVVKINKVYNAFHQEDPIKWQFDVEIETSIVFNLKKSKTDVQIDHYFRTEISELTENPQIITKDKVTEYKDKAFELLKYQFERSGL